MALPLVSYHVRCEVKLTDKEDGVDGGKVRSRQNILHKHLEVECQTVSTFSIFRYMTRAPDTEQDTGYTHRMEEGGPQSRSCQEVGVWGPAIRENCGQTIFMRCDNLSTQISLFPVGYFHSSSCVFLIT